jgi:hypothetical protein
MGDLPAWVYVGILSTVLVVGFLLLAAVVGLKKSLQRIEKQSAALEKKISEQEKQIAGLRAALDESSSADPLVDVVELFSDWKQKGPAKTLTAVAVKLFGSYLKRRKTKSLPAPKS